MQRPAIFLLGFLLVSMPGLRHSRTAADSREPESTILNGRIVGVTDGDTLDLLVDEVEFRIRLAQIDAPEKGQPHGKRAKAELSRLAFGKRARVHVVDVDRYGRSVGELYVDHVHVNAEMVRQGHAWGYTKYSPSAAILDLEDEARREERGLWRLPPSQRVPPWLWRSGAARRLAEPRDDRCGSRRTCSDMKTCAEALFHWSECGLTGLDGDADGVPCEKLCRD